MFDKNDGTPLLKRVKCREDEKVLFVADKVICLESVKKISTWRVRT